MGTELFCPNTGNLQGEWLQYYRTLVETLAARREMGKKSSLLRKVGTLVKAALET
jgi:hypothetical protein